MRVAIIDDTNVFVTDVITPPLFDELAARGMDVKCYVPRKRRGQTPYLSEDDVKYTWSNFDYPFTLFWSMLRDRREVAIVELELVTFGKGIAMLPLFLLLCKAVGCRTIINLQGTVPLKQFDEAARILDFPPYYKLFARLLFGMVFSLADQIQVFARPFASRVLEYGEFEPKIRLVEVGVRGEGKRGKPGTYFLAFGHVAPRKGLEHLLSAWRVVASEYPDARLIVAGEIKDVAYAQRLKEAADPMTVTMMGTVPDETMYRLFEGCKAAIFPYVYSDAPSGPLVIAMERRKPVIVSRTEMFSDFFASRGGALFCDPGDPDSLAKCILTLIEKPQEAARLEQEMRVTADGLSWHDVGERYAHLIEEVVR